MSLWVVCPEGMSAVRQAGGNLPHGICMHGVRAPLRTHQCTRQLPPLRRQLWIKLTHSLKCFLLEKKATWTEMLGSGRQVSQELPSPPLQSARDRDPGSSVQPACRVKGNTAWERGGTASSERGWPHHLGRRLSSRHEERAPTMDIFWPFRDVGMGRARCHSLGPVTGGPGRIVSRGLEEGPQRARLQPESIPVLRCQC